MASVPPSESSNTVGGGAGVSEFPKTRRAPDACCGRGIPFFGYFFMNGGAPY